MHFKPRGRGHSTADDSLNRVLGRNIIKEVTETKFLGVYIGDKLSWQPHIKFLNSKLKCKIGKLNAIRNIIPSELYNNLYHTLFKSHLSYGISAWGGVSKTSNEPCDRASHWTSVTCVSTRSRLFCGMDRLSEYCIIELDVAGVTVSSRVI